MIDIENSIFNTVALSLRAYDSSITVTSENVAAPSSYPCVSIEEADNYAHIESQDSASTENYANVMYEVHVYTNKTSGKKSQCKNIFAVADEEFNTLGFTRTMKQPVAMDDAKTYHLVARYTAVVSQDKYIFRR